jgi:hypothetical protein
LTTLSVSSSAVERREQHQRYRVRRPNRLQHAPAVESRQPDVEQDEIGAAAIERLETLDAIGSRTYFVAFGFEVRAQQSHDLLVVFD